MTIVQIIPIFISAFALLFSIYTYCRHDAKIKKQSELINEFQIEKLKKETNSEKSAIIEANVIKNNNGKRIIKVFNKGKSTAKNVNIRFPEDTGIFFIMDYPNKIDIKPQNAVEIIIHVNESSPDTLKIDFDWQDDLNFSNKDSQIIQI